MILSDFLNDTQIAIENGFGDAKIVSKMFQALQNLELAIVFGRKEGPDYLSLDEVQLLIENALKDEK